MIVFAAKHGPGRSQCFRQFKHVTPIACDSPLYCGLGSSQYYVKLYADGHKRDSICSLLWPWELPVLRHIKLTVYHSVFLLVAATHTYVEEVNYKTSEKGGVNTFRFI